jgi:DNA-binding transcriptional regulator LsrR (DeoR family)
VVELHFFAGLTQTEVSESLGISPATVNRELRMAKAWLGSAIDNPQPKAP